VIDGDHSAGQGAPPEDHRPRLRGDVTVRFEIPADLTEEALRSLLDECHRAAEVAVGRVLTERGYEHGERSRREQVYQVLREGPPLLEPDGFDAVVAHTLRKITDWLRDECEGGDPAGVTVETVRALRGMLVADHDAVIRACFRACKVRGSQNLGKADAMKTSRVGRARRESRRPSK
jgi:hypothetical protein